MTTFQDKGNLPDAIQNDCKKCTQTQREGADQVMHYIIDHRSADWGKLEEKYKSDGTYKKNYLESKEKSEVKETLTTKAEDHKTESKTSAENNDQI
ncbi:putative odorant-binding protein A10 [Hyposmocoma kahamanoa]|uniref:putative odorant-binding protein A10 n=1 Tax=Hyposmocoma kahamanoa TaxID=1477025 RepID=UPI000E6D7BC1|nr:putative odorant-binding protein A10 [Hyposmocoma kahamanoa]